MVNIEISVMRVCNGCIIDDFGVERISQGIDWTILFLQGFASRSSWAGVMRIGGGGSLVVRRGNIGRCGVIVGRGSRSLSGAEGLRGQALDNVGRCIIRPFFYCVGCGGGSSLVDGL